MKILIIFGALLAALSVPSAFARNLGALSDDQRPQYLLPASEFVNFLNPGSNADQPQESVNSPDTNSLYYGWYGSYWPYYSYYGYYPYSYYGYWWLNDQGSDHSAASAIRSHLSTNAVANSAQPVTDRAQAPVVCFASDSAGNFFASVDVAANVANTQEAANNECLAAGASCTQSLGCALAY